MDKLYPIVMKAGIQKDGTAFSSRSYIDGIWCRFQRGLPQTIGGYESIFFFNDMYANVPRGTIMIPYNEAFHIYWGTNANLYVIVVDEKGNVLEGPTEITPADFVPSVDISWTFDFMFSVDTENIMIIAHPGYNLNNINNRAPSPVYFGNVGSGNLLTSIGEECSGGIVVLNPYLMLLDNDGTIRKSAAGKPNVFNLDQDGTPGTRITSQKLLAGRETRGGQFNPCGLIWSCDTLFRYYYTPSLQSFRADKIGKSSLLSNNAIAEMDNIFIWAGTDRFMYYNGTINALPNTNNTNFFFQNLNYQYRNKVFAVVRPYFNEVWFHYPSGTSKECNNVVIFNKAENAWYNTPEITIKTCGYFDYSFNKPISISYDMNIWMEETGYDKKGFDDNGNPLIEPIVKAIETGNIAHCAIGPDGQFHGIEKGVNLKRLEPDFKQGGTIYLYIKGKDYANGDLFVSNIFSITKQTLKVDIHKQLRELTLRFVSYEIGGYFEMGNVLLDITFGDTRP